MSNGDEEIKDVHSDERKSQNPEASSSTMECDRSIPEKMHVIRTMNFDDDDGSLQHQEALKVADNIKNMAIAHEISLNKNFKISTQEPDSNTLYAKIKEIVHKAFWDILAEQLSHNPPIYTQALQLLEEIKMVLEELLCPHNVKTKENMNEVLDIALIKQQAEKGVLDFSRYSQYVITLMSKICAPARDKRIEELKKCTDVIETFKGIMEVLYLMRLDLTNFTIHMCRPTLIASSIEYEKEKFNEFLKVQENGLQITTQWLLIHLTPELISAVSDNPYSIRKVTSTLVDESYLDLLEFDYYPTAETLMLDLERILDIRNKTSRLAIMGSIMLLLKPLKCLISEQDMKTIKEQVTVLLEPVFCNKDLETIMPNILVQVKVHIQKIKDSANFAENSEQATFLSILDNQILELSKKDHKVRQLVTSRIRQFLKSTIESKSVTLQIPPGLELLQKELSDIATKFQTLITHNKRVHEDHYLSIVTEAINKSKSSSNASTAQATNT